MNALLDAALGYARAGLPVFPVRRDKRPRTEHGFKDATLDPTQIRDWWTRFPDDGIGMPTGSASGIVAVDVDPRNGGSESLARLVEEFGQMPAGPSVITGGGGTHYYLQHPGGTAPVVHGFRPGLDFQGDGAYIVVPPSPHASGLSYRWAGATADAPLPFMPSWLFKLVYDHAPAPSAGRPLPEFPSPTSDKEALERVLSGPNGDLHRWVYERRLAVSHVKDHAAYVAFCTALLFAGATEEQVPRILRFTPDSWEKSGRAQWRHLAKHGGYYRRRDTLVRVSALYREALADLRLPPPAPAGSAPEEEAPAPGPSAPPFPADLFYEKKNGQWEPSDSAFRDWFRREERFVVPVERGTFSTGGNFELLRYSGGYYNGTARAFVRGRVEDAFRHMDRLASTDSFREEVIKGLGATSEFHRSRDTFNPPDLLCLSNGVLDLATGGLRPHTPDIVFTWRLPVAYDSAATCPRFEQFLSEVLPDTEDGTGQAQRELLVDMLGYCLRRENPFQVFFLLVGDGANGKTTLGKVIEALFGKEAMASLSLQQMSSRFHPAELDGRLVNLCDDLPFDRPIRDTGALKVLTGDGTMMVERKGQHPFQLAFGGKMISMANRTPEVTDDTYAFWRRPVVFKFEQTFPEDSPRRDPELKAKLLAEMPGILNLALRGLRRVRPRLAFDPEGVLADAEEEWRSRADPVRAELLEDFEVDPDGFVPNRELFAWHVDRCQQEGREPLSEKAFGRRIARAFPKSQSSRKQVRGKDTWGRPGIRRKQPSPVIDIEVTRQAQKTLAEEAGGPKVDEKPATALSREKDGSASPVVAGQLYHGMGNEIDVPRAVEKKPATTGDEGGPAPPPGSLHYDAGRPSSPTSDKPARKVHSNCALCARIENHVCYVCGDCVYQESHPPGEGDGG